MPIFRKRPVEVECERYTGENGFMMAHWSNGDIKEMPGDAAFPKHLEIKTKEGVMSAQVGDWIIRGIKGEFYPCKPDIFEATYEETIPF